MPRWWNVGDTRRAAEGQPDPGDLFDLPGWERMLRVLRRAAAEGPASASTPALGATRFQGSHEWLIEHGREIGAGLEQELRRKLGGDHDR